MACYIIGLPKKETFSNGSKAALAGPLTVDEVVTELQHIANGDEDALPFGEVLVVSGTIGKIKSDFSKLLLHNEVYDIKPEPTDAFTDASFVKTTILEDKK